MSHSSLSTRRARLLAVSLSALAISCLSLPGVATAQVEKPTSAESSATLQEGGLPPKPGFMLLDAAELQQLGSADGAHQSATLRVLDVRSEEDYAAGHVPGAVWMNFSEVAKLAKQENGMHDKQAWSKALSPLGIKRDDTLVVVYGDKNVTTNTRAWWLLKYVGMDHVALLDGGFDAWTEAGFETSTEKHEYDARDLMPEFQSGRLVEISELKDLLDNPAIQLLDTRSAGEFTGEQARGGKGGRIPGAAHVEWSELVDDKGRFKPREELLELFKSRGALPDEECITYCQSGGRASTDAFALELLGYPKVRVYYASWSEWGADENAPVQKGEATSDDQATKSDAAKKSGGN